MADVVFVDLQGEIREDARGFFAVPWRGRTGDAQGFLETLHLASIHPGQVRGNHAHPRHREGLYLFCGQGTFTWKEESGKLQEKEIGGHTLVLIPPGVAHALKNSGKGLIYLVAWREGEGAQSPEPDTVPQTLVE